MLLIVHTEKQYKDELGVILFFLVFIGLLPVISATTIMPGLNNEGIYNLIVGTVFLLQVAAIVIYYFVNTEMTINRELLLFAWLFMLSQSFTIYLALLRAIEVDNFDLINIFVRFIAVSIFVVLPSNLSISKKGLHSFMSLIVLLGVVASVYNLVINFKGILNILSINNPYAVNYKSFFINRNGFAQFLFFAIVANTYLFFTKKSTSYLLIQIFFILNLVATLSRGAIVSLGIFLLLFYFLYFKERYLTKIIILLLLSILVIIIAFNKQISDFIIEMVIREEMGTTSRIALWQIGVEILNQYNWLLGIGYFTSTGFLNMKGYSITEFHSFYIDTLVGGGIVDLLLYLALFSYIILRINNIYRNDRHTGVIYFASYLALFFYGMFESISFFSMGYVSTIFTIFFITIPLLYSNNFANSESVNFIDKRNRFIGEDIW